MSDDRLFASNNAIGRKWFFFNIIILFFISAATTFIFNNFIIPDVRTQDYLVIAKTMLAFLNMVYIVTFLSLVDRRVFDILGDRESIIYKILFAFVFIVLLFNLYVYAIRSGFLPQGFWTIQQAFEITFMLNLLFCFIIIIICFVKGRISNISFDEYSRRIRYK